MLDVAPEAEPAPEAVTVIRLLDCPPGLLLAHDDNLADVARELNLFGASHADPDAVEASRQIGEVVRISAMSWGAARLVATQALQEGRDHVDIAIAVADAGRAPGACAGAAPGRERRRGDGRAGPADHDAARPPTCSAGGTGSRPR